MNKDRGPKAKPFPEPGKSPRVTEGRIYYGDHPSWRIGRMDFVDPFGWHSVDADRLKVIHERLGQLETQTWGDILIQAKKQNHSVAIDSLCKEARDRAEYALFETLGPGARVGFSIKGFSLFCGGTLTTLFVHPCANDS